MNSPTAYKIRLGQRFKRDLKAARKKYPELGQTIIPEIFERFERGDRCGADCIPGYPAGHPAHKLRIGTNHISPRDGFRMIFFPIDDSFYVVRFYQKNEATDIDQKDALAFLTLAMATAADAPEDE